MLDAAGEWRNARPECWGGSRELTTIAMRAIFLSYRRDDSEGEAGRLFDDLVGHFGENSVFMDVAAIEAGRDFRKAIDESVATCGVLLAVVGREWTAAKNEAGQRRLDDPFDFVRLETASALKRDIPVIPVLVHGAKMPRADQLPDDLKEFAYRNGVELTHARWNSDLQLLIKALRPHVGDPESAAGREASTKVSGETKIPPVEIGTAPAGRKKSLWAILALVAVIGGALAMLVPKTVTSWGAKAAAQREAEQRALADRAAAEKALAEQKALADKLAADRAAMEKAAAEKAAVEKAEADRIAAEKAATEQKAREDKLAAEKVAAVKAAVEKAEADRIAAEKAAAEQKAREDKEAANRTAAERALAEKGRIEKAEAERIAAEKEAGRRKRADKETADRAAAKKAGDKLIADKKAEAERIAAKNAEEQEQARADKIAADKIAAQRTAEIIGGILGGALRPQKPSSEEVAPPFARPVPGMPGFVYSPFNQKSIIDVKGLPHGKVTIDPNSGKPFRVP